MADLEKFKTIKCYQCNRKYQGKLEQGHNELLDGYHASCDFCGCIFEPLKKEAIMKDVMLDFETFGNTNNAVIVQIGACYFDRKTGDIGNKFFTNVDADSGLRNGFEMNGSVVYWWLQQSKEAKESILKAPKEDVMIAINDLNIFLKKAKCIWSHAPFDFVILMNHLKRLNYKPMFHYRTARDLRTLVDLAKIDHKGYRSEGIAHNALDDCIYQVRYAVDCLNAIDKRRML